MKSREYRELDGIDGEPAEFGWNIYPEHAILELLREIKRRWQRTGSDLKNSKIESSSCRCTATSIGQKMDTRKHVFRNLQQLTLSQEDFRWDIGHSLGPGNEEKRYGTHTLSK